MGDFPNWTLPSALAVAKQVYSFLFAYSGVLIALIVGLVLHWFCWKCSGLFNWIFNCNRIASRQLKSNLLLMFWQIKNYTLVGNFDFWGCLKVLEDFLQVWEFLWKWEASSKNNENTIPISGGCGWERIFYIITVITAVGVASGSGRHYNTYYVNIAWGGLALGKTALVFGMDVSG
jgi:hypothetical protein